MKTQRKDVLIPNGIPRYIRCYDNEGKTFDRYTVVYTGRYRKNDDFLYVGMSANPFDAQGFGQHGWSHYPIDRPTYGHLGKKITFADLPDDCRELVIRDYMFIWKLNS